MAFEIQQNLAAIQMLKMYQIEMKGAYMYIIDKLRWKFWSVLLKCVSRYSN